MKKKDKKQQKKDYRKHLIFLLISIVLYITMKETALKLLLFPIGIFLGYYTTIYGKFIPHITPETMTATSIFAGMLFGMSFGFPFGVFISLVVYAMCGMLKLTTLVNSLVIASGAIYSSILMSFGLEPSTVFLLALLIRSITGILAFWNITADKVEAMAHAIVDPIFNMAFYMPFFLFLYNLVA